MNSRSKVLLLRTAALEWLKFEKRCALVMHERIPTPTVSVPDVIGITHRMQVVEVEIKITMADFRANGKKWCFQLQKFDETRKPYQFFFLVWPDILDAVKAEMPVGCGLMSSQSWIPRAEVIIPAPINRAAKPLDKHQWARAVNQQGNALVSAMRRAWKLSCGTEAEQ